MDDKLWEAGHLQSSKVNLYKKIKAKAKLHKVKS